MSLDTFLKLVETPLDQPISAEPMHQPVDEPPVAPTSAAEAINKVAAAEALRVYNELILPNAEEALGNIAGSLEGFGHSEDEVENAFEESDMAFRKALAQLIMQGQ